MWENNSGWTFSLLWIIDSCFYQKQQFKVQHLQQDINWSTGVVQIACEILWRLDSHSDGTHAFTAEHPLLNKSWDATFLQICSDEEANSSTSGSAWRWDIFQQMFSVGRTIPLKEIKPEPKYFVKMNVVRVAHMSLSWRNLRRSIWKARYFWPFDV